MHHPWMMTEQTILMRRLQALIEDQGTNAKAVSLAAGLHEDAVRNILRGKSKEPRRPTISAMAEVLGCTPGFLLGEEDPVKEIEERSHIAVRVLPAYAGMGGGGVATEDLEQVLFPRSLVEDELHAKGSDLLAVECRGDSMSPTLLHGDQVLVDRREFRPTQPGVFALRDGEEYVIKRVEKIPRSDPVRLRIFSENSLYSEYEALAEEIEIMGRVVWFGRRLT